MSENEMLNGWYNRLRDLKDIHFEASATYSKYHHCTGIPLVILAALANAGIWSVATDMHILDENIIKLILAFIGTIITVFIGNSGISEFRQKK